MIDSDEQMTPPGGWLLGSVARISSQELSATTRDMRLILWLGRRIRKVGAVNLLQLAMKHRRLARRWLPFATWFIRHGALDRSDIELAILRVAWNCRCGYEWAQHVDLLERTGMTAHDLERVQHGSAADGWNPRQEALLDAVDDLHRAHMIADGTWARLTPHYRTNELIELCMLVGHYEMLAGLLNSFGVPLEERANPRPTEA
jgi:alkylhydroperoxidase family enzyme